MTFQANAVKEFLTELKDELRQESLGFQPPNMLSTTSVSTLSTGASSTISALQQELSTLKEMVQHITQPAATPLFTQPPPQWMYPPQQYLPYPQMQCQQVTQPKGQQALKKPQKLYYCWTHGTCFHSSDRCRNGHLVTKNLPLSATVWTAAQKISKYQPKYKTKQRRPDMLGRPIN